MPTDSQRLSLAVARLNRRLRQERESDLTPTQLSTLGTIRHLGQPSPSQIAARERVSAPSITRTLNHLVEAGLVERTDDPDDGRRCRMALSDLGEKTLAAERQRRDEWLDDQLRQLGPRQRGLLREAAALIERLADS